MLHLYFVLSLTVWFLPCSHTVTWALSGRVCKCTKSKTSVHRWYIGALRGAYLSNLGYEPTVAIPLYRSTTDHHRLSADTKLYCWMTDAHAWRTCLDGQESNHSPREGHLPWKMVQQFLWWYRLVPVTQMIFLQLKIVIVIFGFYWQILIMLSLLQS